MHANRFPAAIVVVVLLAAAGCLGGSGGGSDLAVTGIDGDWTDGGTHEVEVTVDNRGDAEGTGTVFVEAEVRGGDTYTERREVTVPAGRSATVVVAFEPPPVDVGSGFDATARME